MTELLPESEKGLSIAIYKSPDGNSEVTVHVKDGTVLLTETEIAEIFETDRSNINRHINNIFGEGELAEEGNVQKIHNGFSKPTKVYSLEVIISVGYRVNSKKATHFRQWATEHLTSIATKGYSLDTTALTADPSKMEQLVRDIRRVRTSEMNLYQKVREVFKLSSSNYEQESNAAHAFFAFSQDKLHFAITQKTAAELVLERADGDKVNVGMIALRDRSPTLKNVTVAKNYLSEDELQGLENISEQFLLFAESKAFRKQKMTMEELATKLNILLMANDYPVLYEYKEFKRGQANTHAKKQLEKYRGKLTDGKNHSEPVNIEGMKGKRDIDKAKEAIARFARIEPPNKAA